MMESSRSHTYLSRPNLLGPAGLLPKISSISFICSGVNLANTLNALQLSTICSGFVAPKMTVLTFSFFAAPE